ncbi:LPS translocon maturation chaperone LptM [Rhodocyclus tenuis]|uniref:Putative small lipoprotein YifL n=1 Tax=Rhodocyclus tenuis TaxID=1066 RepID=A0A840G3T4_RHOTE|nr:lipoprotein [Rhodocyclus tenuis]MBB4245981.1 putative small lipoprotein YifL [Rhodocyclus tenuis]
MNRLPARSAPLILAGALFAGTLLSGCGTRGPLVLPPKPASAAKAPAKPATAPATTSSATSTPDNPSTQTNKAETAR